MKPTACLTSIATETNRRNQPMFDSINAQTIGNADLTDVKNLITDTVQRDAASVKETAQNSAEKVAANIADVPIKAIRAFEKAMREAFASVYQYAAMTMDHYASAFWHWEAAITNTGDWIRAGEPMSAWELIEGTVPNVFLGMLDIHIAQTLETPLVEVFKTGFRVVAGRAGIASLSSILPQLAVIIAVGYASLKVRDWASEKVEDTVDDFVESVRDAAENGDLDVESIDIEGETAVIGDDGAEILDDESPA